MRGYRHARGPASRAAREETDLRPAHCKQPVSPRSAGRLPSDYDWLGSQGWDATKGGARDGWRADQGISYAAVRDRAGGNRAVRRGAHPDGGSHLAVAGPVRVRAPGGGRQQAAAAPAASSSSGTAPESTIPVAPSSSSGTQKNGSDTGSASTSSGGNGGGSSQGGSKGPRKRATTRRRRRRTAPTRPPPRRRTTASSPCRTSPPTPPATAGFRGSSAACSHSARPGRCSSTEVGAAPHSPKSVE